jgi:uncharacterized membrane protein
MSLVVRRAIILLALIGFASAAASTYVHYQLVQDPGYTSFCDISDSVSCTQVYLSRFGSVNGIPVALLGTFWFGLVLLLTMAGGRDQSELGQNIGGYLLVLSTLGLSAVLFLGYASFMVLGTLCVLCAVVYVAVVGIFLLSGAAASVPLLSIPRRAFTDLGRLARTPAAMGVAGVCLALTVAVALAFSAGRGELVSQAAVAVAVAAAPDPATGAEDAVSEFERFWDAQPRVELPVARDGAKVLVLKFNDYECPSCAKSYLDYEPVFARYESSHPGAVRHISLDYPLDPECNAQTPRGGHMGACEAAVAVRLARRAGRDGQMARWLYENQQNLSRETIREALAEVAGVTDFDAMYDATLEDVKADIALGGTIEIDATPTFIINGVQIKGGLQVQFFDAAIALELERAAEVGSQ